MAFGQQPGARATESSGAFSAAGIGTGTRPIDGLWQFHLGDDMAWAQPGFDDRGWERLPADQPWGDAGHPKYTGFVWYRRQIALDPTDKKPLGLLLPPLNSVAEVYWNGVKVGGIGTMPPHAHWYWNPQPAAVPLPSSPGASSATLAIRLWERPVVSNDGPDDGGFQAAPLIGYGPLIEQMREHWVEHRLRSRALSEAALLLVFFVSIPVLILWLRSRSQWVLFCVGEYFLMYALYHWYTQLLSTSWVAGLVVYGWVASQTSVLIFLVLLLADLPQRPGLRGARFWWGAGIGVSLLFLLASIGNNVEAMILLSPYPRLFHFLDIFTEILGNIGSLFLLVLIVACFFLSRLNLPRLLFFLALALDLALGNIAYLSDQSMNRLSWLFAVLQRPLLRIDGSNLSVFLGAKLLLLLAIVYALWDRLTQQAARQRFVDAELKAAQEIQQVMVPAAVEREAPGYAVHSVYRPASEVGGDFFQIIPLEGDETLIVAGDVSGKGLRAAMTVSLVVGTLRTLAEHDPSPAAILAGLNRRLIGRTQGGFVTCCAVRIDSSGHTAMANAGHCQPYVDGLEIALPSGLPLGIIADVEYEEMAVDVSHGQQLTLLSDGVVEARNPHGELYGFDRLHALMQQRPSAEHVADTAVSFGQEDDITVLTVTRLAAA